MKPRVVLAGIILLLSPCGHAQSLIYQQLEPPVIVPGSTSTLLVQVLVSGSPTRVTFESALQLGIEVDMKDDGTGGDRVAGDGIYTITLPTAPIFAAMRPDDVYRPWLGYFRPYSGTTSAGAYSAFAEVADLKIPRLPVVADAPDVQHTDYVVNILSPQAFPSNAAPSAIPDPASVTQRFFALFPDVFDVINIVYVRSFFQNRHHVLLRNAVHGIGLPIFDNGSTYGSSSQLQGISVFPIPSYFDGADYGLQHEFGHQWINFLNVPPVAAGIPHWPLSTMASGTMGFSISGGEGGNFPCTIVPDPNGVRIVPKNPNVPVFGDLDLYLMGLLPPDQVGEQIILDNQDYNAVYSQCNGSIYSGTFTKLHVSDLTGNPSIGPRIPDSTSSPKQFRLATIVVTRDSLLSPEAMAFYSLFAQRMELQAAVPFHMGFQKDTVAPFAVSTRGLGTMFARIAQPCTYSYSSGGQAFTALGGTGTITITTGAGCAWTIGPLPSWVTLTSPSSGLGNGTVTFQVLPNTGGDLSASFTIAGKTFTIEQEAASITGLIPAGSLAQIASEGTWDLTLTAINLGASSATARFSFLDNNGNPQALPLTFPQSAPAAGPELAATLDRTLNPNAQIVMESTGPDSAATLVGSGQLLSNGNVTGFGVFSNPKLHWNAVVPLETRTASRYILAFDNTAPLTTGVAVANLAAQAQNVAVIIRDDAGTQIGNPTIPLVALGHTSFMLNDTQLGFPVTNNKRGTIEFDMPPGGQLSVLGLRVNGAALTTLPVLANVGSNGGSITHVAYNGGWTSVFYIVNTGSSSAQFTLSFVDENGVALAVPLLLPQSGTNTTTAVLTRTLAAGEMLVVDTNQQDSPTPVAGSAQLTTTGNIGGFEIFRWNTFGQEASVPLETRTPNSFVLVFDDTNGLTTGVALASTSGLPVNITATFRDDTGGQIGVPQSIALAAHAHKSFLLPDLFQTAAGKRGMVEFAAPQGQTISVIGLRARSSDGTLTTIPVLTK
jgi:hypothetical protein